MSCEAYQLITFMINRTTFVLVLFKIFRSAQKGYFRLRKVQPLWLVVVQVELTSANTVHHNTFTLLLPSCVCILVSSKTVLFHANNDLRL